MRKIKSFVVFALMITLFLINNCEGMTEKQMAAAVKLVKNTCLPKSKANPDDIDKMHKGDWNIDHSAMCYMHCTLNMYKLVNKNNTLNYESAKKQILGQLPEFYKDSALVCLDQCKDSAVTLNDKCMAAYEITKCVYFCNPEKYYLP